MSESVEGLCYGHGESSVTTQLPALPLCHHSVETEVPEDEHHRVATVGRVQGPKPTDHTRESGVQDNRDDRPISIFRPRLPFGVPTHPSTGQGTRDTTWGRPWTTNRSSASYNRTPLTPSLFS